MSRTWSDPCSSQFVPSFSQDVRKRSEGPVILDSSEFTTDEMDSDQLEEKLFILKTNLETLISDEKSIKAKGVRLKNEAKVICGMLLRKVAGSLFARPNNEAYPLEEVVHDLVISAQRELADNEAKYSKNPNAQMDFTSTEMCVEFVRSLVAKGLSSIEIEVVELCIVLQNSVFNTIDGRYENITCELLYRYAEKVPIVEWKSAYYNALLTISRRELLARLGSPVSWKRAESWAKIGILLISDIKWHRAGESIQTHVIEFIDEILQVVEPMKIEFWKKRIPSSTIFDFFSSVIDEWGILYWEHLTPRFLEICLLSLEQLNGLWLSALAIQDKYSIENAGRSFWSFLERVLAMAAPGCEMVNQKWEADIRNLAENLFHIISTELIKASSSNARTPFELPDVRISLLSRLLCLSEAPQEPEPSSSTKRTRYQAPLELFCTADWDVATLPRALITVNVKTLHSFFETYSHRFPKQLDDLLAKIWTSKSKFEKVCDSYCHVLALIAENSPNLTCSLWNSILEWVLAEGSGSGAARLCLAIIERKPIDLLQITQPLELLSRNQIKSFHEHRLLQVALDRCKIDEFLSMSLPNQPHTLKGNPFFEPWRFRNQLVHWLLNSAAEDVADIIIQLLKYYCNPSEEPRKETAPKGPKSFENRLCDYLLIPIQPSHKSVPEEEKRPNVLVPKLGSEFSNAFQELWTKESLSNDRRLYIWRQMALIRGKLKEMEQSDEEFIEISKIMDDWLIKNFAQLDPESWYLLDLGEYFEVLPSTIRDLLLEEARNNEFAFIAVIRDERVLQIELTDELEDKILSLCSQKLDSDQVYLDSVSQLVYSKVTRLPCEDWIEVLDTYGDLLLENDKADLIGNLMQWEPSEEVAQENGEAIKRQFLLAQLRFESREALELRKTVLPLLDPLIIVDRLAELDPEAIEEALDSLLNNKAFVPKIIRDLLTKKCYWSNQIQLLSKILNQEDLLEIALQRVPNFIKFIQFYVVPLLINIENWPTHPEIKQFRLLLTDEFVTYAKRFKNHGQLPSTFSRTCFPSAFRCDPRHFPSISKAFASHLKLGGSLALLPALRVEAAQSVDSFQELRFFKLLASLTEAVITFFKSDHPHLLNPFLETVLVCVSHVLDIMKARSLPLAEVQEMANERRILLDLVPSEVYSCAVYVSKEILLSYRGSSAEPHNDIFLETATEFTHGKWPKEEHVFFCLAFWKALDDRLTELKKTIKSENEELKACLDHVMLVWDSVDWLRPHIAPSSSTLMILIPSSTPYTFEFGSVNGDEYFLKYLYRFCRLILANYRETNFDKIRFALRLMCCSEFKELKILTSELVDQDLPSNYLESVPLSQALSPTATSSLTGTTNTVEACQRLLRGLDVDNAVIRTLYKNIANFPALSTSLLPVLCALDHSEDHMSLAIPTVLNCEEWATDSCARTARCLSECLDALSIERLVAKKETFEDTDRLYTLADVLTEHGFTNHAKLLFHLYSERILQSNRFDLGFRFGNSLCQLPNEACEFASRLYAQTKEANVLKILPAVIKMRPHIQRVLLFDAHDWVRLLGDEDLESQSIAASAMGLTVSMKANEELENMMFKEAWKMRNWHELPFPKRSKSHEMDVYSLSLMDHSRVPLDGLKLVAESLRNKVYEKMKTTSNVLKDLCQEDADFRFFEKEEELSEDSTAISQALQATRAFIRCGKATSLPKSQADTSIRKSAGTIFGYLDELVKQRKFKPAINHLQELKRICVAMAPDETMTRLSRECDLQECSIRLKTKDYLQAKNVLNRLVNQGNGDVETTIQACCQLTDLSVANGEGLDSALEHAKMAEGLCAQNQRISMEKKALVYRKVFETCCGQLESIEAYRESKGFRMKHEAVAHWETTLKSQAEKKSKKENDTMDTASLIRIKRERRCEIEAITQTRIKMWKYAEETIAAGLQAIAYSSRDQAPQILFSVIDLLFRYGEENPERDNLLDDEEETKQQSGIPTHASIVQLFENSFSHLDTSKWVLAVSHICSHAFKITPLGQVIKKVMIKLLAAHPYQVASTLFFYEDGAERSPVVIEIVKTACNGNKKLYDTLKTLRNAHKLYKNFCEIEIDKDERFKIVQRDGKTWFMADKEKCELFKQEASLLQLPLPIVEHQTIHFNSRDEQSMVCWAKIDPYCQKADGQSRPIILNVIGSDGKKYRLVFKKEDVRQDSLVEQLFSVVNTILATRQNPQPLRTYKVVPLSEKTGIIEFCIGTTSMKALLCGEDKESGLHAKIHPRDLTAKGAISIMAKSMKPNTSMSDALNVFEDICKRIRPVFRHHFYESFPSVSEWLRQLDAYTTSLAHWCIVCYVIGLGDRHTSNILFEPTTSRFVHIDLGMILEYSKRTLPVPEQVPFRLTRDFTDPLLADGMGKLADRMTETMQILRSNHRVILGLASVFLREFMSNFKEAHTTRSYTSMTAIARLRDKLSGTDASITEQSAEQQVRRLISEATDRKNLARIYYGWMPFL